MNKNKIYLIRCRIYIKFNDRLKKKLKLLFRNFYLKIRTKFKIHA